MKRGGERRERERERESIWGRKERREKSIEWKKGEKERGENRAREERGEPLGRISRKGGSLQRRWGQPDKEPTTRTIARCSGARDMSKSDESQCVCVSGRRRESERQPDRETDSEGDRQRGGRKRRGRRRRRRKGMRVKVALVEISYDHSSSGGLHTGICYKPQSPKAPRGSNVAR